MAQMMTASKPDILFGLADLAFRVPDPSEPTLGQFGVIHNIYEFDPRVYRMFGLTSEEIGILKCGIKGRFLSFPLLVVERKADGGSGYACRNQLFTGLISIYEAHILAQRKISTQLPCLALGMVNVGDNFELYCMINDEVRLSLMTF